MPGFICLKNKVTIYVPREKMVAIINRRIPLFKLLLEKVELIPETNIKIAQQKKVLIIAFVSLKM